MSYINVTILLTNFIAHEAPKIFHLFSSTVASYSRLPNRCYVGEAGYDQWRPCAEGEGAAAVDGMVR